MVEPDGDRDWQVVSTTRILADPAGLSYSFRKLESGTVLQMDLVVTDFWQHRCGEGTVTVR